MSADTKTTATAEGLHCVGILDYLVGEIYTPNGKTEVFYLNPLFRRIWNTDCMQLDL